MRVVSSEVFKINLRPSTNFQRILASASSDNLPDGSTHSGAAGGPGGHGSGHNTQRETRWSGDGPSPPLVSGGGAGGGQQLGSHGGHALTHSARCASPLGAPNASMHLFDAVAPSAVGAASPAVAAAPAETPFSTVECGHPMSYRVSVSPLGEAFAPAAASAQLATGPILATMAAAAAAPEAAPSEPSRETSPHSTPTLGPRDVSSLNPFPDWTRASGPPSQSFPGREANEPISLMSYQSALLADVAEAMEEREASEVAAGEPRNEEAKEPEERDPDDGGWTNRFLWPTSVTRRA